MVRSIFGTPGVELLLTMACHFKSNYAETSNFTFNKDFLSLCIFRGFLLPSIACLMLILFDIFIKSNRFQHRCWLLKHLSYQYRTEVQPQVRLNHYGKFLGQRRDCKQNLIHFHSGKRYFNLLRFCRTRRPKPLIFTHCTENPTQHNLSVNIMDEWNALNSTFSIQKIGQNGNGMCMISTFIISQYYYFLSFLLLSSKIHTNISPPSIRFS